MVKRVFKQADGRIIDVNAKPGMSVTKAAGHAGVKGLIGECGGSLSCAPCPVYGDPARAGLQQPEIFALFPVRDRGGVAGPFGALEG